MCDEAVPAKTGTVWSEWFRLLDGDGATKLSHKDIAMHLRDKYDVGKWWCQRITVEYERARDLHRKTDDFAVSVSKTINTRYRE